MSIAFSATIPSQGLSAAVHILGTTVTAPVRLRRREITGTSAQAQTLAALSRLVIRPALDLLSFTPPGLWPLDLIDKLARVKALPTDAICEAVALPHCSAEWVTPDGAEHTGPGDRVVLYLHGGAFLTCGLNTHRRLVAAIAREAGARALSVDYRMMPKHTVADAIADGLDAYRFLLEQGYRPEQITVAGDSAGGYLAFAVPLAIRDAGLPLPGAIAALSPLTCFDPANKAEHRNADADAMFSLRMLRVFEKLAADVTAAAHHGRGQEPRLDPADADLAGLPPVLIQAGSTEVLLADAEEIADRLVLAGVETELQVWAGQLHVFQSAVGLVPEARRAVREIGRFVLRTTPAESTSPALWPAG
jgi:acetyl esterase/lipase